MQSFSSQSHPSASSLVLALAVPFVFAPHARAQQAEAKPKPPAAMQTIGKAELLRHANYLASDELGGRLTGSPGQIKAAEYIAGHFADLGLEPLGDELEGEDVEAGARGYTQRYPVERTAIADTSSLKIGGTTLTEGYALLGARAMDLDVEAGVQFVGFGRTRGNDAEVEGELDGRIAVACVQMPKGNVRENLDINQKFGMSFGVLGQLGRTARGLTQAGAGAIVFVMHEDAIGFGDVLNYVAISPGKAQLKARFPGADAGMSAMGGMLGRGDTPVLVLAPNAAPAVLKELGVDAEAFAAFAKREGELPEAKGDVAGRIRLSVVHDAEAYASNVVAVLRGSDPKLRDEAIVYSAHMDHVGRHMNGDVFNGADDNASGSAGLLAIASAYAKQEQRPRRSVIFLSVSGEELGLWGSHYFSDNPTWPLDKIVADINTDMIGRSGPESGANEVTVTPSNEHEMFSTIVRDAARFGEQLEMSFTSGDKYYQRSDHYNFARKGIPVVFFCNGEHEDYHQVSDHADKLDGDKMERIARLAFWTGQHVANADEAPRRLGPQKGWQ